MKKFIWIIGVVLLAVIGCIEEEIRFDPIATDTGEFEHIQTRAQNPQMVDSRFPGADSGITRATQYTYRKGVMDFEVELIAFESVSTRQENQQLLRSVYQNEFASAQFGTDVLNGYVIDYAQVSSRRIIPDGERLEENWIYFWGHQNQLISIKGLLQDDTRQLSTYFVSQLMPDS